MTYRFTKFLKSAAFATLLVFTTQTLLQSAPIPAVCSAARQKKKISAPLSLKSPTSKISINRGRIEEQFLSKSTPFVYLVEDAHDSQDAQESIRQILKQLVDNEKVSLVCFEGGSEKLDRSFYDFARDPAKNIRIWDELFKQGQIGGLERYALEASESVKFSGLENKKIYFENIHSIQKIYREKEKVAGVLKQIDVIFDELAGRNMTGEVKKIRDLRKSFDSGRLNLLQYASELVRGSELSRSVISKQEEWPQLARLLKLREFEVKLKSEDEEIQKELGEAKKKTPADLKFIWIPEQHEKIKGHLRWYFEKAVDKGINFKKYPHLTDWVGYQILQDELSAKDLFRELERYEADMLSQTTMSEQAKIFLNLDSSYSQVKKLVSLELSRKEWNEIKQKNLNLKPLAKQLCVLYKETFKRKPKINVWDALKLIKLFDTAKSNYQIVEQRDTILAKRIQESLEQSKARKMAVITGGFHTDMIAAFLKGRQIGYAVISPVISDVNRKLNYRALVDPELSQTRQPVVSAFGNDEKIIPFQQRLKLAERTVAESLPRVTDLKIIPKSVPVPSAAASLGKKKKEEKKIEKRRSKTAITLFLAGGILAAGSVAYAAWRLIQPSKPAAAVEVPGLRAAPLREDLKNYPFEYVKRKAIHVPSDFPLLMIPMIHQGKDQEAVLRGQLRDVLKTSSNVLWIEGGANPSYRGIVTHPQMKALLDIPEIKLSLENPITLISDICQIPYVKENLEKALEHYRKDGRFLTFELLNRKGAQAKSKQEKIEIIRKTFDSGFVRGLIEEGIETDAALLMPEASAFPVWLLSSEPDRLAALADLHLSFNDVEGAYFYEDLVFRFFVEMVYLRDRELWKELKRIHDKEEFRSSRIVVPIGRSHLADFNLSPGQILIPAGLQAIPDNSDLDRCVKAELEGTWGPDSRRAFIENYLFENILTGQSARTTPDSGKLYRAVQVIFERMAAKKITSGDLIRELGLRLLEVRKSDPKYKVSGKMPFPRPYMLKILYERGLITAEEVPTLEGRSLGVEESEIDNFDHTTLKFPTAESISSKLRNYHPKLFRRIIQRSEEVEIPRELISQLKRQGSAFINLRKAINDRVIRLYVTDDSTATGLFGIPRYEGAVLARDTVPAYTDPEDKRGDLSIYVTREFYEMMLKDLALFAFVIDHEFYEKITIPTKSHEDTWKERGWLDYFIDPETKINVYLKACIDRLAFEGDIEGLDRFLPGNDRKGLVHEYAGGKRSEILSREQVFLTIKPEDFEDKKIDAWRVRQAIQGKGLNVEIQSGAFSNNDEIYDVILNPEYVRDKKCILFFNQIDSDREVTKLLFGVELLKDCKAGSITVILPANTPVWLRESLSVFANITFVDTRDARDRKKFEKLSVRAEAEKKTKTQVETPVLEQFEKILIMPNAKRFKWSGMDNLAYVDIKKGSGKIVLPKELKRGGHYLLVALPDRHTHVLRLLGVLSALAHQGIHPTLFIPYLGYSRQHRAYPMPKYGPTAISANSARAILEAISQFSNRIYGVNLHFTKQPGEMDVEKEFPGLGHFLQICNLNLFPELVQYFKDHKQLNNPVILGADKGAKLFAEEAARRTNIEYGGHMDKDRISETDSSVQRDSKLKMKMPEIDVTGRDIILLDDLIASGGTIVSAVLLLKSRGAKRIFVGAVYREKSVESFTNKKFVQTQMMELKKNGQLSDEQIASLNAMLESAPLIDGVMSTNIPLSLNPENIVSLTKILDLGRLTAGNDIPPDPQAGALATGASLGSQNPFEPLFTYFDKGKLVTQFSDGIWVTSLYDAAGHSVSKKAVITGSHERTEAVRTHVLISNWAGVLKYGEDKSRFELALEFLDQRAVQKFHDEGWGGGSYENNPFNFDYFKKASFFDAIKILLAKADKESRGKPLNFLFSEREFSEGSQVSRFLEEAGYTKDEKQAGMIVEAARLAQKRKIFLPPAEGSSLGKKREEWRAGLGQVRSEEIELAGEKYILRKVPENAKLGINIKDFSQENDMGDQKINLHLFVALYEFVTDVLEKYSRGDESLLQQPADEALKKQMRNWLDPSDPQGGKICAFLPALIAADRRHFLRSFFDKKEIDTITSIQTKAPGWFFDLTPDQTILLHVVFEFMVHFMRIILDRDFLREMQETFNKERARWQTKEVKKCMIPLQFRALFTLFDRSCAGEFRSEDEIKPLISILSELNVPVIRERSDKWAKDSRLWLPHVEGRPRYYLLTDMQDQAYLKVSEAFQKDIFDPEFKDKVVVDISEGGAVVSGVAATPFMIFSNRVESEKIEDLASKIKTIPEYKKSHFYTLPSGYVTFKYHGKTYLFDNGHLDTVIGFIPARATSSGKNILLIDPWYHKEVAENAEFKRLIAEQKIAVFDVEKSEAYLNPTNFGILPDGKFLFNFAPKTIKKLNLKEEAYVSLANENDAMKLMPILGGSVGCLMGLEEIMAKSVSPSVKIKVKKIVISEMLRGMKGITQALIDEIYQKAQSFEGGFLSDSDLQRFIEREYDAFRKSLENTSGKSLGASDTVSLDAVMMVMDACGGIAGFYLKDEAPAIYHSLISRFASTEKLAAPSLVITGPVSAQALLLQIKEHKTVIAYYENEAFKKEFQRQAEAMKVKGEILQEELNRYGYFAYLPKLNLTRAEFVRQVLKNVKLDYDGVGRRSLGRIASESRIRNFMSRVVWEGDETLIRDVIEKLPVIVGRPLKVGSPGPQDHTERDIVVLKLASLLSENPEALEKKGFLTLENGIYVPTDLFFDFLAKAIQDHNFEKLTASMA